MSQQSHDNKVKMKKIGMSIPEDLLQRIDNDRKAVNMNRSQYITENLRYGKVVHLPLPKEDRELLGTFCEKLDGIRENDQEMHLNLMLTGQLTPQMEKDYHARMNELTRMRKELESLLGRRNAA